MINVIKMSNKLMLMLSIAFLLCTACAKSEDKPALASNAEQKTEQEKNIGNTVQGKTNNQNSATTPPRPEVNRLREMAKQVETPLEALDMANRSLDRLDSELAKAGNDEERAALKQKRALVEKTLKQLNSSRQ